MKLYKLTLKSPATYGYFTEEEYQKGDPISANVGGWVIDLGKIWIDRLPEKIGERVPAYDELAQEIIGEVERVE